MDFKSYLYDFFVRLTKDPQKTETRGGQKISAPMASFKGHQPFFQHNGIIAAYEVFLPFARENVNKHLFYGSLLILSQWAFCFSFEWARGWGYKGRAKRKHEALFRGTQRMLFKIFPQLPWASEQKVSKMRFSCLLNLVQEFKNCF